MLLLVLLHVTPHTCHSVLVDICRHGLERPAASAPAAATCCCYCCTIAAVAVVLDPAVAGGLIGARGLSATAAAGCASTVLHIRCV